MPTVTEIEAMSQATEIVATPHRIPDFAALLALGGLWLWFFAKQLKQLPLLPLGEPKLAEAIEHHEH